MTPTEIEKINRKFATEVMGWHREGPWWREKVTCGTVPRYAVDSFDPYHRWDHAAMGLEKFKVWIVEKFPSDKEYICKVWKTPDYIIGPFEGLADTGPAAICRACIEAKKEE